MPSDAAAVPDIGDDRVHQKKFLRVESQISKLTLVLKLNYDAKFTQFASTYSYQQTSLDLDAEETSFAKCFYENDSYNYAKNTSFKMLRFNGKEIENLIGCYFYLQNI